MGLYSGETCLSAQRGGALGAWVCEVRTKKKHTPTHTHTRLDQRGATKTEEEPKNLGTDNLLWKKIPKLEGLLFFNSLRRTEVARIGNGVCVRTAASRMPCVARLGWESGSGLSSAPWGAATATPPPPRQTDTALRRRTSPAGTKCKFTLTPPPSALFRVSLTHLKKKKKTRPQSCYF